MTVAIDITTEQRKALLALLSRFIPGVAVWAYGSRVKWTARPNSDLDLVAFTTPEQQPLVSELKDELAESSAIPFLVDLHVWDEIPERFREIIRKEYVVLQETEERRGRRMVGGWFETTIGQQATLQRGIDITRAEQRSGTVPVISSGGISSFHDTSQVRGPGVLLGRKGVVGSVYFVESDYWPHDTTLWVKDFHGNDPRFVYYFFKRMAPQLLSMDVGSANPTLNRNHVHPIETLWPPLPEQRAIAAVLGALDDKIESNRRTSRALERLARAIFRAWFVDFEPVKAKAAGARSFPGMPQEVFDVLPIRLVESEMGPVPGGWGVDCIGDAVSVRGGGTPSTTVGEYWQNGTHCWLTPKDLSGMKDHILLTTARKITDKGVEKISSGLLPVGTVLLSSRAPVGYLVLSGVPTAINQGFIAMVCDGPLPPLYVFHWTQSVMDEIKNRASGTTFPEISKTAFRPIKVCVPTKPVLECFTTLVEPLFAKLTANIRESQSLERLRDYLLPRLLSGEVRVELAEKSVGSILEHTAATGTLRQ